MLQIATRIKSTHRPDAPKTMRLPAQAVGAREEETNQGAAAWVAVGAKNKGHGLLPLDGLGNIRIDLIEGQHMPQAMRVMDEALGHVRGHLLPTLVMAHIALSTADTSGQLSLSDTQTPTDYFDVAHTSNSSTAFKQKQQCYFFNSAAAGCRLISHD